MISEFSTEKIFWTRKMNLKLVKFIESKPNIWNPKHPKYSSVNYRDKTYAQFAAKYGNEFSGQAVRLRWTNIRCTFNNCLRKLNASRAKPGKEKYKVTWNLWEPCKFLLKVNKRFKEDNETNPDIKLENDEEITLKEEETEEETWTDNNLNNNRTCTELSKSLLEVFKGVQNDAFGIDNTTNGRIGRMVAKKLAQMNPYVAAQASAKIMEILLLFDEHNPLNPNNLAENSE